MSGIKIDGLDELVEYMEEMTVTENDAKKAMRQAIKPIKEGLEKDSPKGATGKLAKARTSVTANHLGTIGRVRAGAYWDLFQEFGTSFQKKNVGYFERSVNRTEDKAVKILGEEILKHGK